MLFCHRCVNVTAYSKEVSRVERYYMYIYFEMYVFTGYNNTFFLSYSIGAIARGDITTQLNCIFVMSPQKYYSINVE